MSRDSGIRWTDDSLNPTKGCTKVSPGCKYCYAETFAERFRDVVGNAYELGFDPRLAAEQLPRVFSKTRHRLVFVNSMSDLFHPAFEDAYIETVFEAMARADWLVFQLLTKRDERMANLMGGRLLRFATLPNIWLGVSAENQKHGFPRVQTLRETPATTRWISVEPLLERLGEIDLRGIHWVVVGGESGGHLQKPEIGRERSLADKIEGRWVPREDRVHWVTEIRDQCREARVPFFFKQWGGVRPDSAGHLLEGETHDEFPTMTVAPVPSATVRRQRRNAIEAMLRKQGLLT